MWLRSGMAVAVAVASAAALIQPLAWKLPYAADVAVKITKKKKGFNMEYKIRNSSLAFSSF